jgi:predicted AlkP superfamily phosphohydrolase/phosphomutase
VLDGFDGGLLFYYFGNVDQVSHMMWRADATRATRPSMPDERPRPRGVVEELYTGSTPSSVRRSRGSSRRPPRRDVGSRVHVVAAGVHLNSWLRDEGYLVVADPGATDPGYFEQRGLARTRAYALGLNGLYVNLKGREKDGIVEAGARDALLREIAAKLLATTDPATGAPAVTKVYRREEAVRLAGHEDIAPDLVIGYAKGTRGSDESALGGLTREAIVDNTDPWSGDHCMDHESVPGVLLTSRSLRKPAPSLQTLAAAILAEFGIDEFPVRGK